MAQTWDADIELNVERAHEIVVDQFPRFGALSPTILGQGWDNLCILYSDETVFRIPRRKLGAELVEHETKAVPALASRLPIPIPDFRFFGHPTDSFPYSFVGYPLLPGETADRSTWTNSARSRAVPRLAKFLNALHTIPIDEPPFRDLPDDQLHRKDPAALLKRIETRAETLVGKLPGIDRGGIIDWARKVAANVVPTKKISVVHGDLYPRHILADANLNVTAIIDWGDAHRGHPAIDLSIAYSFVQPNARDIFFAEYGLPFADSDLLLAQLRATMYGFALAAYGVDVNDEHILAVGREILSAMPLD